MSYANGNDKKVGSQYSWDKNTLSDLKTKSMKKDKGRTLHTDKRNTVQVLNVSSE